MPVLYLDVLIAVNLLIDFLLLSAAARILRLPVRKGRLLAGASVGALSCCMILLPPLPAAVSVLLKLAAAALVIRVTFRGFGWRTYIKEITAFFIGSTLLAGIAYALVLFAAPEGLYVVDGVVYYNISPMTLVLLTAGCYLLLWAGEHFFKRKSPACLEYRLLLDCGKGPFTVPALFDTGHRLSDVFSGRPVVIIDRTVLQDHLPEELFRALKSPYTASLETGSGSGLRTAAVQAKLRMMPFHSLGGEGVLPGFCPSHMTLMDPTGKSCDVTGSYVAVSPSLARGEYRALIGGDLAGLFGEQRRI